jgi:lysylphosphatidylglycerol synthetase-like protein (DUF2156 family)
MNESQGVEIRPTVGRTLALAAGALSVGVVVAVLFALTGHGVVRIAAPATIATYVVLAVGYLGGLRLRARVLIQDTAVRYVGLLRSRRLDLAGASVLHATIAYGSPASYWCLIKADGTVGLKLNQAMWDSAKLDHAFCDGFGLAKRVELVDPGCSPFPGLVPPGLAHPRRTGAILGVAIVVLVVVISVIVVSTQNNLSTSSATRVSSAAEQQAVQVISKVAQQPNP